VSDWLLIGSIVGAHGIQGEVKIYPETDFPERFTKAGSRRLVTAQGQEQTVKLLGGRLHGGMFLVRLEGVVDRTQAENLRGAELFVSSQERPQLKTGEFFSADLTGLKVLRQDTGAEVGLVKDILNTGSQDILVIETPQGERMVPFVEPLVPVVNVAEGWLMVVPIAGLLEPDLEIVEVPE